MNYIDLTLDDDANNSSMSIPTTMPIEPPPTEMKSEFSIPEDRPPKVEVVKVPPKNISDYDWIEVDISTQEIDYVKTFCDKHKNDKLDYKTLNIEALDPNFEEPNCYRGNVIDKILKSLAKDGEIKSKKKHQDDYDANDKFVDDSVDMSSNIVGLNQLTPAFDDFICLPGDIEQFKKSNYYDKRLKMAKKHASEVKKQQKPQNVKGRVGKKSGKDVAKKDKEKEKNDDMPPRPDDEVKKVKKNQFLEGLAKFTGDPGKDIFNNK